MQRQHESLDLGERPFRYVSKGGEVFKTTAAVAFTADLIPPGEDGKAYVVFKLTLTLSDPILGRHTMAWGESGTDVGKWARRNDWPDTMFFLIQGTPGCMEPDHEAAEAA